MTTRTSIRLAAAAFLAALVLASAPVQAKPDANTYASIAYSQSTGKYGYSYGYNDPDEAREAALKRCKARDAKILFTVGNGWVALALGDDTDCYGYGYGTSRAIAESHALKEARKRTKNCYIAVSVYSGD